MSDRRVKEIGLDAALHTIRSRYGAGAIQRLDSSGQQISVVPSGITELDVDALGIGGLPVGRVIEFFGHKGSGKSTLALHFADTVQSDRVANIALIDMDHSFDPNYATSLGIEVQRLLVAQPDTAEEALDIAELLVRAGIDFVIIDGPLIASHEVDDPHHGLTARLMSQALRRLTAVAARTQTTVLFLTCDDSKNGNALKFYASTRLRMTKIGKDRIRVQVVKNKLAPPFKSVNLKFALNGGLTIDLDKEDVE